MTEVPPVLRVTGLSHRYGHAQVLDDVTFDLHPGEVVAVIGPSGAGKTTLFRCITQLTRPDGGQVELCETELTNLRGSQLREARRPVGMIFQAYNLVRRLNALDNVLCGRLASTPTWRLLLGRASPVDQARAAMCLDRVGLLHYARSRADRLSGGQQQRVAIARVLAQETRVVLADEPVASLDPTSSAVVLATLRDLARQDGIAVLCSLHQIDLVAGFADRVIGLRGGRVVFDVAAKQFSRSQRDGVYRDSAVS